MMRKSKTRCMSLLLALSLLLSLSAPGNYSFVNAEGHVSLSCQPPEDPEIPAAHGENHSEHLDITTILAQRGKIQNSGLIPSKRVKL